MSRLSSAAAPRDPFRAIFLCLVVLAQLMLPTAFETARAADAGRCVTTSDVADSGKGKQTSHAHGQECAHCRPQVVVLTAPVEHPQVAVTPALETVAAVDGGVAIVPTITSVPPPTGPPALFIRA